MHSAEFSLSLGTSEFAALRGANQIYVDKTDLIFNIASQRRKFLLIRPRRFGKSLLVSTFASLFKNGVDHFSGLAIEKLWQDRKYDVVRLDFSGLKEFVSKDHFEFNLRSELINAFSPLGFHFDKENADVSFFVQLRTWLNSLPPSSLVLLIDEYDTPLTAHLGSPEKFKAVRAELEKFYAVLKNADGCLRFFFMTGITKFSNTSIFSEFNNFNDISLNSKYSAILGLTEEEIVRYFDLHLIRAQKVLRLSREELLQELKENYDGFCFDRNAQTHVYCPWSVLSFLQNPEEGFLNYWYESGGRPAVLKGYLASHRIENPFEFDEDKQIRLTDLQAARGYETIGLDALLTQAGYLTIKSVRSNGTATIGYPNREVELSIAQLYADELLQGKFIDPMGASMLSDLLGTGTLESIVRRFNDGINQIDYHNFPIASKAACRACIQLFLMGSALIPEVEKHSALGRSDLEVAVGSRRWVFEFKFAHSSDEVENLLKEGEEQMRSRRYGEGREGIDSRALHRAVLVFNGAARRFEAYRELEK